MTELTIWGMIILIPTGLFLLHIATRKTVGKEDLAVLNEILSKAGKPPREQCRCVKRHQYTEFLAFLPISFSAFMLFAFHRGFRIPLGEKETVLNIILSTTSLFLLFVFIIVYLYAAYWTKEFGYKAAASIKPRKIEMFYVYSIAMAEWFAMAVPLYFTRSLK